MLRKTRQRNAIKALFAAKSRPLTPQEVFESAKQFVPGLGLATVYRTINGLIDEGFLLPVEIPGQPTCFEVNNLNHHHYFHCDCCERTFEVPGCLGELQRFSLPGFLVERHALVFFGRCVDCKTTVGDAS